MFRLLQSNPQLRQGIFKVRPGHSIPSIQSTTQVGPANNAPYSPQSLQLSFFLLCVPLQVGLPAGNLSQSSHNHEKLAEASRFLNSVKNDPQFLDLVNTDVDDRLRRLQQVLLDGIYSSDQAVKVESFVEASRILEDKEIRNCLQSSDLVDYTTSLNYMSTAVRFQRLRLTRNRDSDHYENSNLKYEATIRQSLALFIEYMVKGDFKDILSYKSVTNLFYTMNQYSMTELLDIWETGVTNEGTKDLFMKGNILAIAMQIAYQTKRYDYEQISIIFNTALPKFDKNASKWEAAKVMSLHSLLCSLGSIAIEEGDSDKGLDCLETLLKHFEQSPRDRQKIEHLIAQLHLAFVGKSKDIEIARHFFNKIIEKRLPYNVKLKTPFVIQLLENMASTPGVPFTDVQDTWLSSLKFFKLSLGTDRLRYLNINNTFFKLFFSRYPQLTEELVAELRKVISVCQKNSDIDEIFLNTIILNYNWGDKEVLEQIISYYSIFRVSRTPVSYRICLKKCGEIEAYTNQEIYDKWVRLLKFLDAQRIHYIPIAEWAALRDATILSPYTEERKQLYVAILEEYGDYIQDFRTCVRFCKHWQKQTIGFPEVSQVMLQKGPFFCNVHVGHYHFSHLKKNINFAQLSQTILFK